MSDNILDNLNPEQRRAVEHKSGPLLIVAGAGTGKTTVATKRIAHIIQQEWARPEEILALTFTEKAAGEMEERVIDILSYGYFDLWISTFHSFAEKILREEGLEIGLPTDFQLLNEFDQYVLFKKNLDKFDLDHYKPLGNPTKFIKTLLSHFSRAKDEDISPAQYLEYSQELEQNLDSMLSGAGGKGAGRNFQFPISNLRKEDGEFDKEVARQEVLRIKEIANAYHTYQRLLLENSYLDFGDLIMYCLKLFRERPAVLEKYRQKFKYILLDEFQDTNWSQYELIKILAEPRNNLVVVGDDEQAIFRFRGASMSNILEFQKDFPDAKQVFLVKNYRNGQKILDTSYDFIVQNNPNRLEYQLNKQSSDNKLSKKLKSQTDDPGKVDVISASTLEEEMKEVTRKIVELKERDKEVTWDDFAVLARTNEGAREICQSLEEAGLPYLLYSSKGLYNKDLIIDIIAYLRVVNDHYDNVSMYKVLKMPIFNFDEEELAKINYWANRKAWSLLEVLGNADILGLGPDVKEKGGKVFSLVKTHASRARDGSASEMFIDFLNDSGLLQYLTGQEDYNREAALLLNQLMSRIRKFEQGSDDKRLRFFLEELQMEMDAGETGDLPMDLDAGPETIKVMTVHSAKGLEFKYVFITQLVDKRFPTTERKEPLPLPDALIKESLPEGDIHLEEERRLFYVALTRGGRQVCLSWACDYGGKQNKKPSRFLVECGLIEDPAEQKKVKQKNSNRQEKLSGLEKQGKKAAETGIIQLPIPTTFSYTQFTAFANCPYQYKFAHILKIPTKGKPSFSFGKTMHSTLQKVFNTINKRNSYSQADLFGSGNKDSRSAEELITMDEILDIYHDSWIDDWYPNKKQKEENREKGKKILKEFYEKHKDNWPTPMFLEKTFNFILEVDGEKHGIRGAMDRVDETEDGCLKIVDYKTGKPKDKHTFEDKQQLFLYQLVAQQLFRKNIHSLAFYYLENNSEYEFVGSDKDLEKTQEKFRDIIREIKKREFPAKPSPLCQYCDFREICEYKK
jgi:DNA helicase-2/ATP-dependent DNA helicase PcrA